MTLWRLELLRLWRTQRWLILLAVFASFGVLGPLTARYLPDLMESFGEDALGGLPPMTSVDGITQYMGNAAQIGMLAVAFVGAAALAFDSKPEMAIFLRTRATVRDILVPRYVVSTLASIAAFVVGMAITYVGTGVLLEWLDVGAVLIGTALFGLYLAFANAVFALISSFIRRVPGVALLSVGALIVLALLGLVPNVQRWLPSELVGAIDVLIRGGEFEFWRSILTTVVLTVVMLFVSIRRLEAREV
jgi:ABC-2 type transport system permease protein